jgi:transcription antitermination protein NusB
MSTSGVGGRREAREEALAFLYETELTGSSVADALDGRDLPPEDYALAMVEGVAAERDELDEVISRNLKGWRLARMAIVDRTIARMATWELKSRPDVPTGVVLSEAVELATQYCGEDSPRFLNGVLGAVAVELRPDGG